MSGQPTAATATLCRNCGASIEDKFCPRCGQETDLRLPTLREFLREAAGRYVALDGRFWRTMQALLGHPGLLTREYLAGRRRRYIRPARLYLFATLIFFAVSRFFVEPAEVVVAGAAGGDAAKHATATPPRGQKAADAGVDAADDEASAIVFDKDGVVHLPPALTSVAAPVKKRWQRFTALPLNEQKDHIVAGMLRYGPYAMFALLPAFTLLLKLLYIGRRRRYPSRPRLYGEHMVFAAHNHAFLFAAASAMLLIPSGPLKAAIVAWVCAYLPWSMHAVYGGSWIGAVARASLLFVTYAMLVGLATVGLLVAAILLG